VESLAQTPILSFLLLSEGSSSDVVRGSVFHVARQLGANVARELAQRLADISALSTAAELADLFSGDIVDRSPSERALRLEGGHELVFCAGHVEVPVMEDGSTNWAEVSRLRIVALEARRG
jgi:hypothetical protein